MTAALVIVAITAADPPLMKRFVLLVSLLLLLQTTSSLADALFLTVKATPYDRQMARIRPVLLSPSRSDRSKVSLVAVNQWMSDLRSIPYGFSVMWKTPAETQSGAPADCKAKAVALYEKMRANGATNVRLVIGKRTSSSVRTHAWLAWERNNVSFILDPTFNSTAYTANQLGKRNYQPLYAYAGAKRFRAASVLVAQN
jgi:predicted transglutaminase-like cysteine proteinase